MSGGPERQYTVILKLGADSREAVVHALTQIAIGFDGGEHHGVSISGGADYGYAMQTRINPDMTHDEYFKQLEAHLEELRRQEERRRSES